MRDPEELLSAAEEAVKLALALGADEAEGYVRDAETSRVELAGRLATPTSSADTALGVRVLVGGRVGVSGTSSAGGLRGAIEEALQSVAGVAGGAGTSDPATLPNPLAATGRRHRIGALEDPDAQADLAQALVHDALARPGVTYVECKAIASHRRIAVASSRGVRAWDETLTHRLELELRVTQGTTHRSGREAIYQEAPLAGSVDPSTLIGGVVERLRAAFDPHPYTGPAIQEVLLGPAAVAQVVGTAGATFTGRRGAKLGDTVYAPAITLRDEPHGPTGARRRLVDDEGMPTANRMLVERGILVGQLRDHRAAARAGEPGSAGNGVRASASSGLAAKPLNLVLAPGEATFDELVASATRAVYVPEPLLGGFTSNVATGDFSVVAPYAFLVEGGRIQHALGPTTIGGNAHRVLASARAVGRDSRVTSSLVASHVLAGGVSCAT